MTTYEGGTILESIPTTGIIIPTYNRKALPWLIAGKLPRHLVSSPLVLRSMVKLVRILEKHYSSPVVLRCLYYLLHGANLLLGYREGLREFKLAGAQE